MRKLFGTDGIRGVAGDFPLDEATVLLIGQVLGRRLKASAKAAAVVIGQDTRASSGWIADTLARGLVAQQIAVASAGVATTPAVAYLARSQDFGAGIVISASHNPWTDNGIKVFGHDGYKLADDIEYEIEGEIFRELERDRALSGSAMAAAKSTLPGDAGLKLLYEDWLIGRVDVSGAQRFKIVVDCANGAASAVAPEVMRRCGLKAEFTHVSPDGQNINENCGALHPDVVAREVVERNADLGICFDGDADRALFADAAGRVVNGDGIMLMLAREMKARGVLRANTLVATTMSNMGLEAALRRDGIHMLRAPVGDKYVLEEMRQRGATLGGEQSGHIIFADQHTTGDGLLTALRVIELLGRAGRPVAELVSDLKVFPQVIQNVRVREKKPLLEVAEVRQAIEGAERRLDGNGRVVVRYSGTEPLARVMVEAESESDMKAMADSIANAIQKTLGV